MAGKHRNDDHHGGGNYNRNVASSGRIEKDVNTYTVKRTGSTGKAVPSDESLYPELQESIDAALGGDIEGLMPYAPTPTINPSRPRTRRAGWHKETQSLFIEFREGAIYRYDNVPERVWNRLQKVMSTGRMINAEISHYSYTRLK